MQLGIPYEVWGRKKLVQELGWNIDAFGPPKSIDDPQFGVPSENATDAITGAMMFPLSGYVNDPQLAVHNLKTAAEAQGVTFITNTAVTGFQQSQGRITGVNLSGNRTLACGTSHTHRHLNFYLRGLLALSCAMHF